METLKPPELPQVFGAECVQGDFTLQAQYTEEEAARLAKVHTDFTGHEVHMTWLARGALWTKPPVA